MGDLKVGGDMGLGKNLPKLSVSENFTRKFCKLVKNKIIKDKELFFQHKPTPEAPGHMCECHTPSRHSSCSLSYFPTFDGTQAPTVVHCLGLQQSHCVHLRIGETESTVHETNQSTCSVWRKAANVISMTLPQDRRHSYLETKHARF